MTEHRTDRLSEYADGSLDAGEAMALAAHLAECADCSAALAGLRAVTARAAALDPVEPARDLWPRIAARIEPRAARFSLAAWLDAFTARRLSFSLPQLAAAALALVLVSGGAVWMTFRARSMTARPPAPLAGQPAPAPASDAAAVGLAQYDMAIADLERVLAERRAELDTNTVRVVEQNLAAIDRAIAEARRALAVDPTDPYLHDHLASTMRRKMGLLRQVTAAYPT